MNCLQFFFTQESKADIDFSKSTDIKKTRYVNATVHIRNATDFSSKIAIKGKPGFKFDALEGLDHLLDIKMINPRPYGLICTENNVKHFKKKKTIFEFGNRRAGDFPVHYRSERVSGKNSRPKITFEFDDALVNITYVALNTDVSSWHFDDERFNGICFVFSHNGR